MQTRPSFVSGLIGRKSELTSHVRGGWEGLAFIESHEPGLTVLALGPPFCQPRRSSHTQSPALAPRHFPAPNNSRRCTFTESSSQLFPVFVATLPHAAYEWTPGAEGWHLCSSGDFYETKIRTGDPWRSEMQEVGQT